MNLNKLYEHPMHEADEKEREKMMFYNPFQEFILEGVPPSTEAELQYVAILSSN